MADSREFLLIGNFTDNITPKLEQINKQISTLKTNLSGLGGKGARSISRDIGRFASATKSLSDTLKTQNQVISSTLGPMRQYRVEVGKTIGALNRLNKAGGNVIGIERVNKALQDQIRLMDQLRSRRGGGGGYNGGGGGGGGGYSGRRGRRGGRGGYDGGGGGYDGGGGGGGYASAVFGNQLGNMLTGSIVRGFELGVNLMQKPFQAFAGALGERISDEMGDLQAAGGIFAIAKRQKDPFVKNFDQAIAFQQEMNLSMAKMANSLPGSTQDFVNVQKRLTDTITRVVTGDVKGSTAISNQIRATEEGKKYYGGQLKTDVTTKAGQDKLIRDNINTMSGELTKLTVLAGLSGGPGGGGGVRGPMGPYGLPGLSERMIADESVSMAGMQRYAAIFRDPAIKDALERHIPKLNAAMKGTPARITAVLNMLKEIVTPELVAKLRRSVAGINESLRSTFFSPEAGFLGLGRKLKDMGPMFNDFGQAVDANGNAVKGMTEAAKANLSLYDMLRDIYANTMVALMPIVEGLGSIFDPLQAIGNTLKSAREYTAKFLENFYYYRNSLEKYANDLGGLSGKQLLEGLDLRAALLNVNNLFRGLGIFTSKEFTDTTDILLNPSSDPVELIGKMIKKFFSSEAATKLGEQIGTTIGTVLKELSTLMTSIGDGLGTEIAPGFARGFKEAGGFAAIQNIFVQLLKMFFSAFATVIKEMPLMALVGTGLALAPALIGAGSTALVEGLISAGRGKGGRGKGGRDKGGGGGGGGFFGEQRGTKALRLRTMRKMRDAGRGIQGAAEPWMNYAGTSRIGRGAAGAARGIGGFAKGVGKVGRFVPGGAIAGGALDFALAKASGQSTGKAASGAIGSVIGAAVGSALGPIGTVAGGVLGSLAGNAIHDAFNPAGKAQQSAALLQKEAADRQLEAASKSDLTSKYGIPDLNYSYGQSADLSDRLKMLGVSSNYTVQAFQKEYFERNNAAQILKQQNAKLEEAQKSLTALKLPPNLLKEKLAPYAKSAAEAAARLKIEQGQLSAAVAKMPTKIQDAIIGNVQKVSMQGVADALALKVAGMSVPPPPERNLFAVPNNNPFRVNTPPPPPSKKGLPSWLGVAKGSPGKKFGNLGGAISYEMANKPSGSDLVIANSSETVIPAAGGYGVKELMDILVDGFSSIKNQYTSLATGVNKLDTKTSKEFQTVNKTIDTNQNQNQQEFAKINQNFQQLSTKVSSMSMGGMGGMGGLGPGYGSAGGQIAGQLGNFIKQTGGAPGSIHEHPQHGGVKYKHSAGSYHYQGRAIDIGGYANEQAGILSRIAQFNAMYGVKPVELFHAGNDPKGHSDHVHVAYAYGAGNPAFFSNQKAAQSFEDKLIPSNVKSITSNTGELAGLFDGLMGKKPEKLKPGQKPTMNQLGTGTGYKMLQRKQQTEEAMKMLNGVSYNPPQTNSPVNVTNTITIQQLPGQDADQLAAIVARKIGEAISDVQSSSIFV